MPLRRIVRKLRKVIGGGPEPYPRGHFYSPLPGLEEVRAHAQTIFATDVDLGPSIDLRDGDQVETVAQLASIVQSLDFPRNKVEGRRYYSENSYFGLGSAFLTAGMLLHLRPKRVIEVGSGFSSAMMLDINDTHASGAIEHTFIEPYPERLRSQLQAGDLERHRLLVQPVQQVPLAEFQRLESNDVLFVDSSHVSKIGSDLNHILFNVLPILRPGVVVHFHDIYWPFEYPREWVLDRKRAWNEAYLLRAFMQYNSAFEIVLYPQYLKHRHAKLMRELWPAWWEEPGSALWIRKSE